MNREHYLESDSRSKNIYQKLILLFFWGNIHLTFKALFLQSTLPCVSESIRDPLRAKYSNINEFSDDSTPTLRRGICFDEFHLAFCLLAIGGVPCLLFFVKYF